MHNVEIRKEIVDRVLARRRRYHLFDRLDPARSARRRDFMTAGEVLAEIEARSNGETRPAPSPAPAKQEEAS